MRFLILAILFFAGVASISGAIHYVHKSSGKLKIGSEIVIRAVHDFVGYGVINVTIGSTLIGQYYGNDASFVWKNSLGGRVMLLPIPHDEITLSIAALALSDDLKRITFVNAADSSDKQEYTILLRAIKSISTSGELTVGDKATFICTHYLPAASTIDVYFGNILISSATVPSGAPATLASDYINDRVVVRSTNGTNVILTISSLLASDNGKVILFRNVNNRLDALNYTIKIAHGHCNVFSYNGPGCRTTFSCGSQYKANSVELSCVNGSWNGEPPKCEFERSCTLLSYNAPGCRTNFTCGKQYKPDYAELSCVNGSWMGSPPKCQLERSCTVLSYNGPGCTSTMACENQYKPNTAEMACVNGSWSGKPPECQLKNECSLESYNHHDCKTTFACERKYKTNTSDVICQSGKWAGEFPICKPIMCCKRVCSGTKDCASVTGPIYVPVSIYTKDFASVFDMASALKVCKEDVDRLRQRADALIERKNNLINKVEDLKNRIAKFQ